MKAWELLDSPEKWTQGSWARDDQKASCQPDYSKAMCFCIVGALRRCYGKEAAIDFTQSLSFKVGKSVIEWNDERERTWEEVYQLLKEADV